MGILIIGLPYRLNQVVSPFADDESITIFQIQRIDGDFAYITWPTFTFHSDDVARNNDGTMCCIITYLARELLYILLPIFKS